VKAVLIVFGGLALVVAVFVVWRLYATVVGGQRAYRQVA
jgi:hypothetical protein